MIYYRMLWLAALLVAIAHTLLFVFDFNMVCGLAAAVCGLACWITFNQAWRVE